MVSKFIQDRPVSSEGTWVHASDGSLPVLINWKGGNQTISMGMKIVVKLDK